MKKIEGHNLYKNDSGAVVITDMKKYHAAKEKKKKEQRIDALEEKMNRIEYLLTKLIEK
jgi:hypothetical protein